MKRYEKKHLLDLRVDRKIPAQGFFVDEQENYYVLYFKKPFIQIFNKTGAFIKRIDWVSPAPGAQFRIQVDESGNILLYPPNGINSKSLILDKEGKLLQTFLLGEVPWEVGFSNGIVFSEATGDVLSKLPSSDGVLDQKKFFKDIDPRADRATFRKYALTPGVYQNLKYATPKSIGEHFFERVYAIDDAGNVYVDYRTRGKWVGKNKFVGYLDQDIEICKFNPQYRLMAILPTQFPFINPRNQKIYEFDNHNDYSKDPPVLTGVFEVYQWVEVP